MVSREKTSQSSEFFGSNNPNRGSGTGDEDALLLLDHDHNLILQLFEEIEKVDADQVNILLKLYSKLENRLKMHIEGEERYFFTALEQYGEINEMVLIGYEEHMMTKTLIGSFNSLALDDHRWKAKIKVLKRVFQLHVQDERDLFQFARKVLTKGQLHGITAQLLQLRRAGGIVPPGPTAGS